LKVYPGDPEGTEFRGGKAKSLTAEGAENTGEKKEELNRQGCNGDAKQARRTRIGL
jgi:hypothetical protein